MKIKFMKNLKLIALISIIIIFLLIFKNTKQSTICKNETDCRINGDDKVRVNTMKFNDNIDYKSIEIENKEINKIEGLNEQEELKNLNLAFNEINKIEGLENLENLDTLDLSYNNISKIEGLESLTKINSIYLQGNPIRSLTNVEDVKSSKDLTWYLPYSVESITQESYDYLKNNENIEVYFIKDEEEIHTGLSEKTIDDLKIV